MLLKKKLDFTILKTFLPLNYRNADSLSLRARKSINQAVKSGPFLTRQILDRIPQNVIFLEVLLPVSPQKRCAQDSWLNRFYSVQTANSPFLH